jgi:hypothetical protein
VVGGSGEGRQAPPLCRGPLLDLEFALASVGDLSITVEGACFSGTAHYQLESPVNLSQWADGRMRMPSSSM